MKNFNFFSISFILMIVFLTIFTSSVKESNYNKMYSSLPKIIKPSEVIEYEKKENSIKKVIYEILYNGNVKPQISVNRFSYAPESLIPYFKIDTSKKEGLKIIVDTTQIIPKYLYHNTGNASHPVFIYNHSNIDQRIGLSSGLYLILEAKDKEGIWRPLESQYYPSCGTGITAYILKKDSLCVTNVFKYSGNFKTKLRLKHYKNYSNEFYGLINDKNFGEYDSTYGNFMKVIKPIK